MLVSDTGSVYVFGQDSFAGLEFAGAYTSSPKVVESLKGVFVVQASVGGFFSAALSREGWVYTFCWGHYERLDHDSDLTYLEPRLLSGPLVDALVVQIAVGNCCLLCWPTNQLECKCHSFGVECKCHSYQPASTSALSHLACPPGGVAAAGVGTKP